MKRGFLSLGMALFALLPLSLFAAPLPDEVLSLVNQERVRAGVSELSAHSALREAALLKAQEIRTKGMLVHTTAQKGELWWPFQTVGYEYLSAGENLALTFEDSETVVREWMASPLHRQNLLNPRFNEAGVASIPAIVQGQVAWFIVFYGAESKSLEITQEISLEGIGELLREIAILMEKLAAVSQGS